MVKITCLTEACIQCPLRDFLLQNQDNPSTLTIYFGTQIDNIGSILGMSKRLSNRLDTSVSTVEVAGIPSRDSSLMLYRASGAHHCR